MYFFNKSSISNNLLRITLIFLFIFSISIILLSSAGCSGNNQTTQYVKNASSSNPYIITSPKLGILNLLGKSGDALVAEDKNGLSSLFSASVESHGEPPLCDVLLLYCEIQDNGSLVGTSDSLREIIYKSRAPIVIVASANSSAAYIASGKPTGKESANLVMVLDRKGASFDKFFGKLFGLMYQGKSMPVAWVELAPQMATPDSQADNPDTIFSCEAGHILFK